MPDQPRSERDVVRLRNERVLVVEDEETLRRNLVRYLESRGHTVRGFESAEDALKASDHEEFDVAVIDLRLPGRDGLSLAADLSLRSPDTMILLMTAYGSVESVIDALHAGVHDYMIKPVLLKDVAHKVEVLCEHRRLARENARLRQRVAELGEEAPLRSRSMAEVYTLVRQIAPSNTTVLIEGESGSGKEVVARAIHEASPRAKGPFLAVNMAAIPPNLVESHLFGHERGAYTGAEAAREGMFRAAGKGTIFLDEIGDMPLGDQSKLLRALESKEILPVGSDRALKIDCRILAATNADLLELVSSKRFRSDLYYRLAAIRIRVPPLRARVDDIPGLANGFLQRHAKEHGRAVTGIDGTAMRKLLSYTWPGNVRELSNVIERATVVCTGTTIGVIDLPPELLGGETATLLDGEISPEGYQDAMAGFERTLIAATLEKTGGDRREAARLLGLSLATLYRRIEKLGLKGTRSEEPTSQPHEGASQDHGGGR
jgi:DNA-binding NtrC family response regulator